MTSHQDNYEPETGLLNAEGLAQAVESELSRAARHEVPLSLVYMEVCGLPAVNGKGASSRLVAAKVAEASARHRAGGGSRGPHRRPALRRAGDGGGRRRCPQLAPGQAGREARQHAEPNCLGGTTALTVAVTCVDCQFDEMSRAELMQQASRQLAAAILQGSGIPYPPESPTDLTQAN